MFEKNFSVDDGGNEQCRIEVKSTIFQGTCDNSNCQTTSALGVALLMVVIASGKFEVLKAKNSKCSNKFHRQGNQP